MAIKEQEAETRLIIPDFRGSQDGIKVVPTVVSLPPSSVVARMGSGELAEPDFSIRSDDDNPSSAPE